MIDASTESYLVVCDECGWRYIHARRLPAWKEYAKHLRLEHRESRFLKHVLRNVERHNKLEKQ